MEDYIFMDNEEPKPNINMKKNNAGGGAPRPNSSSRKRDDIDPIMSEVLAKIDAAESVLVALSSDPSVDEIAAAMGLSMALDNAGKRATAIYSGQTPNVLEFLKPEERFETGTESLQDFVIALNKDKADHLRYKIDGDFVKVYVTPYKTTISDEDLEFSRGDFNVDLVISLNVPAATELDAALKEHGRIMHDATSINITTGVAGKFGDLEWVDPRASSVSEMVAKLAFELDTEIDPPTATALLTGLMAATDRFSGPMTTPDSMMLAARLMSAGADQQLVAQNMEGGMFNNDGAGVVPAAPEEPRDMTKLEVSHDDETPEAPVETPVEEPEPVAPEAPVETMPTTEPTIQPMNGSVPMMPSEPVAETPQQPAPETPAIGVDAVQAAMAEALGPSGMTEAQPANNGTLAGVDVAVVPDNADGYAGQTVADDILKGVQKDSTNVGTVDYGKMIDEALNEPLPGEGGIQVGAETPAGPQVDTQDVDRVQVNQGDPIMAMANAAEVASSSQTSSENGGFPPIIQTGGSLGYESPSMMGNTMNGMMGMEGNPAMMSTPNMTGAPEANNVPDMNFGNDMNGGMMPQMGQVPAPAPMETMSPVENTMPMPGQDMTPPPVLPQPDFGEMPPAVPPMQDMGVMQAQNTMPVSNPEPAPTDSAVTVQPDLEVSTPTVDSMGLPQMPAVQGTDMMGTPGMQASTAVGNDNNSSDPSAFKIPGIHT